MDRRRFVGLCAGSLALAAAGCRRTGDPAYARGNTLVVAVPDISWMNYDESNLHFLYLPRLAVEDENGDLQPMLAQSWDHSPDYLEWTYHLRTDARWSDGVPVTAHDAKFTLDLLSHPDVHYSDVNVVTVLDDYTVQVRSESILGGYQRAVKLLPKHVLEHLDPREFTVWDFWLHPKVSAGPYRFLRYVPETMMEFEADPDYFRGKPRIDRVILKFVGDAGLNELLAGNVDIVTGANPAQIPLVGHDSRLRVYTGASSGSYAIYWKCNHPLFRDARVRRALTLAIDRRALLGLLNAPSDLPITDGVFTQRQFLRRQFPEPHSYVPDQSRALLEAADWQDRDGDGVREREGQPFRFTALVRGDASFPRLAVYVQAQLRQVGVQMDVQVLDIPLVYARFTQGDFEAVFQIHQPGPDAQRRDFGRNNRIGYVNTEVFKLTEEATANPDELDRIYRALTEILRDDMPLTRLVPGIGTTFAHRRVQGLSTPFHASPDTYIEDLWLEAEP